MSLKVLTITIIAAILLLASTEARSTARLTKAARIEGIYVKAQLAAKGRGFPTLLTGAYP